MGKRGKPEKRSSVSDLPLWALGPLRSRALLMGQKAETFSQWLPNHMGESYLQGF